MPLQFHTDHRAMFEQQFLNAHDHTVPFVRSQVKLEGARVLEFRDFVTTTCYYLIQLLSGYSNE